MLTTLLVAFLSVVAWAIARGANRAPRKDGKRLAKAPKSLPIIGYTAKLLQPRYKLLDHLAQLQSSMGVKTFEIPSPFLPPTVLINDPACLEYVLREHELFTKGSFFRSRMHDLFGSFVVTVYSSLCAWLTLHFKGDGILNASGPLWQSQRKAGVNVTRFTSETLPTLMEALHQRLTTAAMTHEIVDLQALLLDLMSKFFGLVVYDTVPGPDQVRAFDEASAWTDARFTNPLWQFYELFFGQPLQTALQTVKKFGHEVVVNAAGKTRIAGHESLLDLLLARLPDKGTVADAATTFMSAGRDTTAQAMTWTVYELSKSPKVLSSLLTSLETHSITRDSSIRGPLRTADLHLSYIRAVFAEALRLNPSVPLNMRETARKCRLPDGTVLQAGTIVVWAPYAIARSPAIWGEDPEDFRPERWLSSHVNGNPIFVPRSASEYPVFHGGPRVCIGKNMAEAVGCQVLADLVLNWDFDLVDKEMRKHVGESLTAPMDGGLLVRPRRRVWTDTKA